MGKVAEYFAAGRHDGRVVEADGVAKAFGRVPVVFPVSFALDPGQGLALLGPNGSGKTTLLRMMASLLRPTAGRLRICGISVTENRREARSHVGVVGHDTYLYEDLTGYENLRFWARLQTRQATNMELAEALDAVGMRKSAHERVKTYSAGMKRRMGLARLLLFQPDLLLLDEPHASLDEEGQALVDALVESARVSERSVVIASHDHERALNLCDQVMVMESGRVTFQGDSKTWRRGGPMWMVDAAES